MTHYQHRRTQVQFLSVLARGVPVIITGAMSQWPAMSKWKSAQYLQRSGCDCDGNIVMMIILLMCGCMCRSVCMDVCMSVSAAGRRTVPVEMGRSYMSDDWSQVGGAVTTF